jgi:hypothetical protein
MSSDPNKVTEAVLGFLYKLPKRVAVGLWWVVAALLIIAVGVALTIWATSPDLTIVVTTDPATLTTSQQRWIDSAQKEVASLVHDSKRKTLDSDKWWDEAKANIAATRAQKKIKPEEYEWIGKTECQIEHDEHSKATDLAVESRWRNVSRP